MFRLLRQQARRWMVFIALIDALLLLLAVGLAMDVRYAADSAAYAEYSAHLFWRAALFAFVIVMSQFALGLYQAQSRETRLGVLVRQAVGFAIGTVLLTILYYAVPQAYIGRGVLGLALVFAFVGLALWRVLVSTLMAVELLKRRILVFGAGESGQVRLGTPPSWLVFSEGFRVTPLRVASKRIFDIFAAALILMLAWPWMLLTALAIRIESGPGQPILYFQDRVGERGRIFR